MQIFPYDKDTVSFFGENRFACLVIKLRFGFNSFRSPISSIPDLKWGSSFSRGKFLALSLWEAFIRLSRPFCCHWRIEWDQRRGKRCWKKSFCTLALDGIRPCKSLARSVGWPIVVLARSLYEFLVMYDFCTYRLVFGGYRRNFSLMTNRRFILTVPEMSSSFSPLS